MTPRPAIAAALAALLLVAATAPAATPRASLTDIEDEVMCTVCGTALNIAGGEAAEDQRDLIRDLIATGATKDAIKDRLVAEYGVAVLAEPPKDGFDLAAWLVPGLAIAAALGALAFAWRRRAGVATATPGAAAPPPLDPADTRRVDDELARFDGR